MNIAIADTPAAVTVTAREPWPDAPGLVTVRLSCQHVIHGLAALYEGDVAECWQCAIEEAKQREEREADDERGNHADIS